MRDEGGEILAHARRDLAQRPGGSPREIRERARASAGEGLRGRVVEARSELPDVACVGRAVGREVEQRSGGVHCETRRAPRTSCSERAPTPGGVEKSQIRTEPRGVRRRFDGDKAPCTTPCACEISSASRTCSASRSTLAFPVEGAVALDELAEWLGVGPRTDDERGATVVRAVGAHRDHARMVKPTPGVRRADELPPRAFVLRERPDDDPDDAARGAVLHSPGGFIRRRDGPDAEELSEAPPFQGETELLFREALPLFGPHRLRRGRRRRRGELLTQERVARRRLAVRRARRRRLVHHSFV